MVNGGLQVGGFVLGLIGWILGIVTCTLPDWRKNDLQGEVIESVIRTTGLWVRCTTQATGLWTCDDYDSFFLGLPVALQAARACVCLSMAMGFLSCICAVFGMECTNVSAGNPKMKARMTLVAGLLNFIGGVSVGIAVSWFAANVLQEYWNPLGAATSNTRYVYGSALFVGWISMAVSVIAGLVQCCSSWSVDDEDNGRPYTYNPSKPKASSAEYI
ncbi:claudin-7 [Ciona intestinalis]